MEIYFTDDPEKLGKFKNVIEKKVPKFIKHDSLETLDDSIMQKIFLQVFLAIPMDDDSLKNEMVRKVSTEISETYIFVQLIYMHK